jgi:hypothetical protein
LKSAHWRHSDSLVGLRFDVSVRFQN